MNDSPIKPLDQVKVNLYYKMFRSDTSEGEQDNHNDCVHIENDSIDTQELFQVNKKKSIKDSYTFIKRNNKQQSIQSGFRKHGHHDTVESVILSEFQQPKNNNKSRSNSSKKHNSRYSELMRKFEHYFNKTEQTELIEIYSYTQATPKSKFQSENKINSNVYLSPIQNNNLEQIQSDKSKYKIKLTPITEEQSKYQQSPDNQPLIQMRSLNDQSKISNQLRKSDQSWSHLLWIIGILVLIIAYLFQKTHLSQDQLKINYLDEIKQERDNLRETLKQIQLEKEELKMKVQEKSINFDHLLQKNQVLSNEIKNLQKERDNLVSQVNELKSEIDQIAKFLVNEMKQPNQELTNVFKNKK